LLHKTDAFELVAMHWAPGSVSPIHDHGASRCWVVMLEGALDVDNYDRLDDGSEPKALIRMSSHVRVARGELDHRLNWRELHRVRNASDASAFSVQVYAAPQFDFTIVDGDSFECRRVLAKYDAVYDL
ncbi:MAG TPA: cysteine dioxygenase family protein, partial [Candidatus Baltobacteraceae bacterium]|nr:cysteine dioxygenase family protein [Candidatus Baltobacteraceae bacterium]